MTSEQIKHMVDSFLGWKLPADFAPDDGISFDPVINAGHPFESRREPVGTNLFTATQAEAMVRYMIEGIPERVGMTKREEQRARDALRMSSAIGKFLSAYARGQIKSHKDSPEIQELASANDAYMAHEREAD